MQIIHTPNSDSRIWFNSGIWPECKDEFFEPSYWQSLRAVSGRSHGRGETLFFNYLEQEFVLRHYRRGGMVGKVNDDKYIYLGRNLTRCWQEFNLLMKLESLRLPAPIPVAARVKRDGIWYRGDLITARIEGAQDLSMILAKQRLQHPVWHEIGDVIARFHIAGVYHADLNCHNIMVADQQVWLIDFDKGDIRRPRDVWQQANLKRLRRSLEKERDNRPHFHWLESDWQTLERAYRRRLLNL